ncbi:hypothetical protein [Fibrobacter sp.]|uniref:hypothetical protein n=1 Tax=Fibrobacter sp. TaxID=35828 RepID=UPI00386AA642
MKYSLISVLAAFATLITACSNSSTSGVTEVETKSEPFIGELVTRTAFAGEPVTFTTSGTYTINKEKQLIVMTEDAGKQDVCNFEDGEYSWKPSKKVVPSGTFKYEFFGDTLVFFEVFDGESSEYGTIFVGGKEGEIEGLWMNTYCEYTTYSKETACFNSEYKKTSLVFSNGKFTKKVDRFFEDYLNDVEKTSLVDNYMNSVYEALVGWYPGMYLPGIFYSNGNDETESTIKKYGIKVLDSSDSSQTFTVRKKTYTFKINQAEQSLSTTNYFLMEINVEITDGKTTCVGDYHLREVGQDQCSAKYEDNYMTEYDFASDTEIKDRNLYLLENSDEFDECLMGIAEDLPERDPDYGNLKDSEK